MDENKSQPLHVTGILIYRLQRQVEFLLLNDTFSPKKHWTAPKGKVIGSEDELKCALRNTIEITGLSVKDLRIEEKFRAEITYLSETRPKRVVYYLAQVSDHAHIFTTGEGLNFHWLSLNNAIEKVVYRSMQDVLRQAYSYIENNKPPKNSDSTQRPRIDKQGHSDRLESKLKNLNVALPLDSQRQAMSRQRMKDLQREQRQQNHQRLDKNGNGYISPLHSPVMLFENPLYKTRLCERFETEGFCPYGIKCTFAHGTVELRERPLAEEKNSTSPTLKDGPENPLYKTRLCERFMKENFCQYGPKCNFAHGDHELRERPSSSHNPRDNRDRDTIEQNHQHSNYLNDHQVLQSQQQSSHYQNHQSHTEDLPTQEETKDQLRHYQNHLQHQRLQRPSNTFGDTPKRPSPSNMIQFARSEIQHGIFDLIPRFSTQETPFNTTKRTSIALPQSEEPSESESEYQSQQSQELGNDEDHEQFDKLNESVQKDRGEKELKLETESKDSTEPMSRDTSPIPPTPNNKPASVTRRRPAVNDTVSLKDLLSGKAKPENEKSWMKVVELSNDELLKLGNIRKNDITGTTVDKRSQEDLLVDELYRFFTQTKENNKPLSDEIKEVTRIEMRHDLSKQQLFNIVIRSLYTGSTWDTVHKDLIDKEKLFKTFIRSHHDQVTFLGCWEKFLNQRNTNLLPKAPRLFKTFYDKDYVEEDSILRWYDQSKSTSEVKKKCGVLIKWLKEAEEEDSE